MPKAVAQKIADRLEARAAPLAGHFNFGVETIDSALGEGLVRANVHETFHARTNDITSAFGFTLALALRAAESKFILISGQDFIVAEAGGINSAGMSEIGLDPSRIIFVRARDTEGVLRAGEEAARCAALGAVVIAPWGESKIMNFTASRRLVLAAAKSNVPIFLLRAAAKPSQSAAATRWSVRSAPSRPLEANAPGFPAFDVTLLRHRGGMAGQSWRVEWDRDQRCFRDQKHAGTTPVSRPVVPVSADGQAASGAPQIAWRRAG